MDNHEEKRKHIMDLLKVIIHEARELMIVPECQAETPDEQILSLLVSHHLEWDGVKICQAFIGALEDANFHSLVEKMDKLVTDELGGE